ncbi:MAG: hypothetical protein KDA27_14450 [Candidatus Eisenbacteria bacterium]|uniref:Outer membrane beta-barrel protein n=1 Tax=Eiseniibacteriota bacterium TaxID=2212470 RepID=A0A956NDY9_UNCEI|nr:hypothetical protein [Candidatus Eisenbacteria bacterium]
MTRPTTIAMRPRRSRPRKAACGFRWARTALFVVFCLTGSGAVRSAQADEWGVDAELGFGRDDNALGESSGGRGGLYVPYDLGLEYTPYDGYSTRVRLNGGLDGTFHDGPRTDADEHESQLSMEFDQRLLGGNRKFVRSGSLDFELEGGLLHRDLTYFSRIAGEEYTVFVDGEPVSLADRFDSMTWEVEPRLVLRLPRSVQWIVDFRARGRDYTHDYADIEGVDPLDYDETRTRGRVRANITRGTRVSLEHSRTLRDYRGWTARDLDGNLFAGTHQQFDYHVWGIELQQRTTRGDEFEVGVEREQRHDPFQGYYDHDEWTFKVRTDLQVAGPWTARIDWKYRHREYDRARVGYNPFKPLRDDLDREVQLELARTLGDEWEMFVLTSHENTDERNPSFTFDRNRTWLGVRFASNGSVGR